MASLCDSSTAETPALTTFGLVTTWLQSVVTMLTLEAEVVTEGSGRPSWVVAVIQCGTEIVKIGFFGGNTFLEK